MFTKIWDAVKKDPIVAFLVLNLVAFSLFYFYTHLVESTTSAFKTPQAEVVVSETPTSVEIQPEVITTEISNHSSGYLWIVALVLVGLITILAMKQKKGKEKEAPKKDKKDYLKSFFDFLKGLLPEKETTDFLIPVILLGVLTWVEARTVYDWFFTQERGLQLVLFSVLILMVFFSKPEWFKKALWFVFIVFFVITINNKVDGGGITLEKITPDWIQNWGEKEPEKEAATVKKSAISRVVLIAEPKKVQTFSVPGGHEYLITCAGMEYNPQAVTEITPLDAGGGKLATTLYTCSSLNKGVVVSPWGTSVRVTSDDQFTWSVSIKHAPSGANWN